MYDLDFSEENTQILEENFMEVQLAPKKDSINGIVKGVSHFFHLKMSKLIKRVQEGINKKLKPVMIDEGVSGSYYLRDGVGENTAIFKCIDEEPFAPNNPKGYSSAFGEDSFRSGIKSGEVSLREVAAYYLDEQKIHGVPQTTMV